RAVPFFSLFLGLEIIVGRHRGRPSHEKRTNGENCLSLGGQLGDLPLPGGYASREPISLQIGLGSAPFLDLLRTYRSWSSPQLSRSLHRCKIGRKAVLVLS